MKPRQSQMELPGQAQRAAAGLLTSAMRGSQRAPGSLLLGPAAYPARTNANHFSSASSENQQPI